MAKNVSEKKLVVSPGAVKPPSSRKAAPFKRTPLSEKPVEATSPVMDSPHVMDSPRVMDSHYDAVAALAYSYWVGRGCEGGSPEEDWLRAERELKTGRTATATA